MANYGYQPENENVWTDLAAGSIAALLGYGTATWAKATGSGLLPGITLGASAFAGVVGKHFARRPLIHEALEALGFGGFMGIGQIAAVNTPTLGGKGAGNIPMTLGGTASSSAAAARALAAQEAANRAAAARQTAAITETYPPNQPKGAETTPGATSYNFAAY